MIDNERPGKPKTATAHPRPLLSSWCVGWHRLGRSCRLSRAAALGFLHAAIRERNTPGSVPRASMSAPRPAARQQRAGTRRHGGFRPWRQMTSGELMDSDRKRFRHRSFLTMA
jgi:hypothetical protein